MMNGKRILLTILVFIFVWLALNFIPIGVSVEYEQGATSPSSKFCSLNYMLTCFDTTREDNYPAFFKSDSWMLIITVLLPLLVTWFIVGVLLPARTPQKV